MNIKKYFILTAVFCLFVAGCKTGFKKDQAAINFSISKIEKSKKILKKSFAPGEQNEERRKQAIYLYKEILNKQKTLSPEKIININLKIGELYMIDEEERYENAIKEYEEQIKKEIYNSTADSLLPPIYNFSRAIEVYRALSEKYPQAPNLDLIYYNLGYCYYEEGQKEMAFDILKKIISEFPQSKFVSEARLRIGEYYFIVNRLEEAASVYQELLKEKENTSRNLIIFKLGWIYYSMGNFSLATETLLQIQSTPDQLSSYGINAESLKIIALIYKGTSGIDGLLLKFRSDAQSNILPRLLRFIGDFYKEEKKIPEALQVYTKFSELYPGHPEIPFVENALLEIGEETKGFSATVTLRKSFIKKYAGYGKSTEKLKKEIFSLVKKNMRKLAVESKDMSALAKLINEDAMQISLVVKELSIYFTQENLRQLSNNLEPRYFIRLIISIGDYYAQNNQVPEGQKIYEEFLQQFSQSEEAVYVQTRLIDLKEKENDPAGTISKRKIFIERFSPDSPWFEKNIIKGEEGKILGLIEKNIRMVALYYHSLAQKKDKIYYREAIDYYKKYIKYFSSGNFFDEVIFFLAEALYESGDKKEALSFYQQITRLEGGIERNQKYRLDAAYSQVLIYEELQKEEKYFGENTEGLILSIDLFTKKYADDKRVPELLYKAGEVSFQRERYADSRLFLENLFHNFPWHPLVLSAEKIMAQGFFQEGKFSEAQKWYGLAGETSEPLKEMMNLSIFKKAEKNQAEGNYLAAGEEFLQVSGTVKDNRIKEVALFNAGINFKKEGRCDLLFTANSQLLKNYPDSKFSKGALSSYLECIEDKKEYKTGAKTIFEFGLAHPQVSDLSLILITAGNLYEKTGLAAEALKSYQIFIEKFPKHPRSLEINLKIGLLEFKENRLDEAEKFFKKTLLLYQQLKDQNIPELNYYAAQASFMLAEFLFESFKTMKITAPLKKTLEKKKEFLNKVLLAYSEAAKFNDLEWTTAATYRIGLIFENFKNALLEAEKPRNLSKEEEEDYQMFIEEQAYPFEEKAREAYLTNLKRLYSHQIFNKWIEATLERMALLVPWAYERKEEMAWDDSLYILPPEDKKSPVSEEYRISILNYNERKYTEALNGFKKIIEKDPGSSTALLGLANTYMELSDFKNAEDFYRRVLFLNSENPIVLNNLGVLFIKLKDYIQAGDYFRKSNNLNSEIPEVLFNLANVENKINKSASAEVYLRKMLQLNPQNLSAKNNLAILLFNKQELEAAENILISQEKLFLPDTGIYTNLGLIQRNRGKITEAEKSFLRALEINSHALAALKNLGILYDIYMGKKELAIHYYQKYVEVNGQDKEKVKKWIIALEKTL